MNSRREYATRWQREWRRKYPVKNILSSAKKRAKIKGLEFDLCEDDISIPEVCPVLNIPIKTNIGKGNYPDSISLDRLDPDKGYVKGNVCVISNRANILKRDATLEELQSLVNYLRAHSNRH